MIALVLAALGARRAQAATLLLLAALATAAATAGPVYLGASDAAAASRAVAAASPTERTVAVLADEVFSGFQFGRDRDTFAAGLFALPGFTRVYSAQVQVLGVEPREGDISYLTTRDGVCQHLTIVAGRCADGTGEVVLGVETAARAGVQPGRAVTVQYAEYNELSRAFTPFGAPTSLTVVGIYRPTDTKELYWGRAPYFRPGPRDPLQEPTFTPRTTLDALDHLRESRSLEAIAGDGALAGEHLAEVRVRVAEADRAVQQARGGENSHPVGFAGFTDLLNRIDSGQRLAREVVPLASAPMVALCWFVIFLAVGSATAARRGELALVALRGTRLPARWWLTAGEALLAVLLGAPLGYLLGHAGVALVARVRFGDTAGAGLSAAALPWAVLAVLGAVLAIVLAQYRAITTPVSELLRSVPARSGWWRALAGEALVAALAVVAVLQVRGPSGRLAGVGLLAPGLLAVVVAMLGARLLRPLAAALGHRALRRGRLTTALGALALARRPGAPRLFILLAVAVAQVGFAAAAVDVAGRARAERALAEAGAERVLTVAPVDAGALLAAVRAVDPEGRYAMAVGVLSRGSADTMPRLAVDAARLAAVAQWRPGFGPLDAAEVAGRIRPPVAEPITVRGTTLTVDLEYRAPAGASRPRLEVLLRPPGQALITAALGEVRQGAGAYRAEVPACAEGCRLTGVRVVYSRVSRAETRVVLRAVSGADADVDAGFAVADRWQAAIGDPGRVRAGSGGLELITIAGGSTDVVAVPADHPVPLPLAISGGSAQPTELGGLDSKPLAVRPAAEQRALPGVGDGGVLQDLEYAYRAALGDTRLAEPEVWLAADAPADVAARLTGQGLTVTGNRDASGQRVALDGQAPALALGFLPLAAGFAVLLALAGLVLVAAVERRPRTADLGALRRQGLPGGAAARAGRWTYLAVAAAALPCGVLAAAAAWWAAGDRIPLFADAAVPIEPPRWPGPLAALLPCLVAGVVLLLAARFAARFNGSARGTVTGRGGTVGGGRRPGARVPD
ncbi:FtsX-like permease family protein [Rhizomonospora bruguierae]|uniref:FtsX-like permease family protein n=1 Tax=Rhizomonospora bruguierae TaxID=1581705 RepID=UPI001BD0B0F3|nr:FtsX-like permease family protein [Micromonospora sp. NBRC 107566]